MPAMTRLLDRTLAAVVVLAGSVLALALALISQYGFDLQPCVLCIYQRWPYVAAAVLAAGILVLPPRIASWLFALAAITLVVDAGIAAYHVGVEQHWWAGTAACTGAGGTPQTLEELKAQVLAAPVIRCDEVAFSLFGVSMAGYNFIYASALSVFAAAAWRRQRGKNLRV